MTRRRFGYVRQLPSGRWQASYIGPDGLRYRAPSTFHTEKLADKWVRYEEGLIETNHWAIARLPSGKPRAMRPCGGELPMEADARSKCGCHHVVIVVCRPEFRSDHCHRPSRQELTNGFRGAVFLSFNNFTPGVLLHSHVRAGRGDRLAPPRSPDVCVHLGWHA